MSRVRDIAVAAGLNHQIHVTGIDDALSDSVLARVLAGDTPDQVVAAVGAPIIQDGGARRPFNSVDVRMAEDFVKAARTKLNVLEAERREITAKCQRLGTLLEPEKREKRR